MPRLHAIELLPDDAGAVAVRRDWQALRDAGLPSMLDHTGGTNTPHVTLLALPDLGADVEAAAVRLVGSTLPVSARTSGLALFGGERLTLARLLDIPEQLAEGVLALRTAHPGDRHPAWTPHLTLGRRIPRDQVQRAVEAVGYDDVELSFTALRRWDPERREVWLL